eukprot:47698-Eustigmatos_ZCMA.PRE.1
MARCPPFIITPSTGSEGTCSKGDKLAMWRGYALVNPMTVYRHTHPHTHRYWSSEKVDSCPAPRSTTTLKPSETSLRTVVGVC